MAYYDEDHVYPVTRITAGTVGEPGQRIFVIQAQLGDQTASWVIEKEQAISLSRTIPKLLTDIQAQYPELGEPLVAATPNLALNEPLGLEFRVGSMGLSYDRIHDLIVLTLVNAAALDPDGVGFLDLTEEDHRVELNLYTTRGQALLLGQQAESVVVAGRPLCPNCGEPIDDFGHFCLPSSTRGKRRGTYLQ